MKDDEKYFWAYNIKLNYNSINEIKEDEKIRFGPPLDPSTKKYVPSWEGCLIGVYEKDLSLESISLENAYQQINESNLSRELIK